MLASNGDIRELVMCGWVIGLDKVSLTKMLRAELGCSLTEGTALTDRILDNEEVRISLRQKSITDADLLRKLQGIGVRATITAFSR